MRVVLANGCFDPFHYGHLRHLQAARKLGDLLVVSVTKDSAVNKGPGRPVFSELERAEVIAALRFVHEVLPVESSLEALELVRPQVFVKGSEYKNNMQKEDVEFCARKGIEIVFTDEPTHSSTALLHHYDRLRQD